MKNDIRELPRHVDGRVKIGFIPIKSFFKILPFCLIIFLLMITNLTPISLFIGVSIISILVLMVSELSHRETGLDILRDMIRYEKQGDIHFERNTLMLDEYKKLTKIEIKKIYKYN